MGQQDDDYYGDYLDTITSNSSSKNSQDGTLPLPTTDDGDSSGGMPIFDVIDDIEDTADSANKALQTSFKDLGEAAATRDFQQAHGDGWEYDADAMIKQIERLEDIRDKKLRNMLELSERIVGVTPPADEKVSNDFIDATERLGESHNTQLKRYRKYLDAYIDTLRKIDKMYQDEDDQAAQELLSKEI